MIGRMYSPRTIQRRLGLGGAWEEFSGTRGGLGGAKGRKAEVEEKKAEGSAFNIRMVGLDLSLGMDC